MIYKLHYFFVFSGMSAIDILLGVFISTYTDATPSEIGLLYMLMPFVGTVSGPIICSYADRSQAHRQYLIVCQLISAASFFPFILIPYLGPAVYIEHARFCWYFLVSFKVVGIVALVGVMSISNSLAINYAKRIGTDYNVYRVWGSISWMLFGLIVGQLNEIWFLPKYAAGFMVLVASSLLDAFVCYLWPREYFKMVTPSTIARENEQYRLREEQQGKKECKSTARSLMPKEIVYGHAKDQLWALVTCCCFSIDPNSRLQPVNAQPIDDAMKSDKQKDVDERIDRKTQISVLLQLLRRDPRIICYGVMFVVAGLVIMPLGFFFMSLEEICHSTKACNFSQLGGYLQASMAIIETCLFVHIKNIVTFFGRLNTLSITFGLAACKFLFYGTIWANVNPHWSLLSELASGIIYGTFLTILVEMGHLFSCEMEPLIPELVDCGVIKDDDEESQEKLKLSLSATLQALMSSAYDGLGRGIGGLVFGRIIDIYSYQTLWLVIAYEAASTVAVLQIINIADHCCGLKFGMEKYETKSNNASRVKDTEIATVAVEMTNIENGLHRP